MTQDAESIWFLPSLAFFNPMITLSADWVTAIATLIAAIVALVVAFLPSFLQERKRRREILKGILSEIRINYEKLKDAEETSRGKRVLPDDFPFSTEIYESLMSQVASTVDADILSMVHKSYHQIRKLNAANIKTESKDKLAFHSSPYGWMKYRDSENYYYIKEKASEVVDLLRETIGMLKRA